MKRFLVVSLVLLILLGWVRPASADLAGYFKKPEPAYRWEKRGEKTVADGTIYDLHLVSQTWQGMEWEHRLQIFRPNNLKHTHFCTLLNTGGSGGPEEEAIGLNVAKASDGVFAILYNIPKQPLYGGLTEDALIVYTWGKFLETGDESWPLHFPMAKAVLKAMDTIQAFTKQEKQPPITEFMITGASKRGWTTWLAGASRDKRIKAIAPMVIDTLNVAVQIPHQLAAFGKPSEEIDDYSKSGMLEHLKTPRGQRLLQLEDPYSYRDILTLPKLIILGTNDRYWAQDALNLYWDDLKGPKWVTYTPNSGHGLEDRIHVFQTMSAFADTIARKAAWPKMKWDYTPADNGVKLVVKSDVAIQSARLFRATASTQDFRDSKWTSAPMEAIHGGFTANYPTPTEGFAAIFGEVTYKLNGKTFTLSTQIRILGKN